MRLLPATCLLAAAAAVASAEPARTTTRPADVGREVVGTAVYAGDTILLDYYPTSQLRRPHTPVERARFPAVDVHCHWSLDVEPDAMLAAMDHHNLSHAVNLSGGSDVASLRAMRERFADERFVTLCSLDYTRLGDDAFYLDFLRDAEALGVRGLKVWKDLGLTLKDADGRRVAVDDARLDVVWRACGEMGWPVLIHAADPMAFFEPIDANNERWAQLFRHPSWSFHGDAFPSHAQVLAEFERVVTRHPGTTFITAHLNNEAEDLASLAERMRRLPNLHADISGRVAELGRQPYSSRRFLIEFQDRVMFGTDRYPGRPDQPRYRRYFQYLETDDEYFDYHEHAFPPTGEWKIHGVFLPDEVLEKVYGTNARRAYRLEGAGG